jgi:hypothetical protein
MDPLNDLIEFNTLPKNQPIAMFDQNGKPRRRIDFGHARRSSIPLISYSGGRATRQAQRHGGVVPGLLAARSVGNIKWPVQGRQCANSCSARRFALRLSSSHFDPKPALAGSVNTELPTIF